MTRRLWVDNMGGAAGGGDGGRLTGGAGRSGQRTKIQRENHILAERQRREEMNHKFCILKSLINKASKPKKDKASIVKDAIEYIMQLEKDLKSLQRNTSFKRNAANEEQKTSNEAAIKLNACPTTRNYPPLLIKSGYEFGERTGGISAIEDCSTNSSNNSFSTNSVKGVENDQDSPLMSSTTSPIISSSAPSQLLDELARNERSSSDSTVERCHRGVQVEVHNLGKQAVVKVVCARSKGLVLRILAALDECKVEILQSNVTTIDHQVVHFLTIEVTPGISASLQCMEAALQVAASDARSMQHIKSVPSQTNKRQSKST